MFFYKYKNSNQGSNKASATKHQKATSLSQEASLPYSKIGNQHYFRTWKDQERRICKTK